MTGVTPENGAPPLSEGIAQCLSGGGYPERFAEQEALGHNSKAVHHACSKNAEVTVPSMDDWEKQWERGAGAGRQRTDDGEDG